jgi:uncharacterized membrane protein YqjE
MEKIAETILKFLRLDNLVHNLTGYVEAKAELLKIEVREEVAKVVASALMISLLILLALLTLLFLSIGVASYLNSVYESNSAGYWMVAAAYAVPGAILLVFRKKIAHSIEKHLLEHAGRKRK